MLEVTRTLSRGLGSLVEELEMSQPQVITMETLSALAIKHHLATQPKLLAARLRERGWLLPTGTRGVWEFAPGAHAGPYGHADPTTPLRAALAGHPGLDAALALGSAAWAHGFADRVPPRLEVAVPAGRHVPAGLHRATRATPFTAALGYVKLKGVPTHRAESILVHLVLRPIGVRSWTSVREWLPDLAAALDVDAVLNELHGRPAAVAVRAGYLTNALRPDLAEYLYPQAGLKVWFGPRGPLVRHNARWQIADTILPFDPTQLPNVVAGGEGRCPTM
jgi:predicted transcriptional regulator of viral defense system